MTEKNPPTTANGVMCNWTNPHYPVNMTVNFCKRLMTVKIYGRATKPKITMIVIFFLFWPRTCIYKTSSWFWPHNGWRFHRICSRCSMRLPTALTDTAEPLYDNTNIARRKQILVQNAYNSTVRSADELLNRKSLFNLWEKQVNTQKSFLLGSLWSQRRE